MIGLVGKPVSRPSIATKMSTITFTVQSDAAIQSLFVDSEGQIAVRIPLVPDGNGNSKGAVDLPAGEYTYLLSLRAGTPNAQFEVTLQRDQHTPMSTPGALDGRGNGRSDWLLLLLTAGACPRRSFSCTRQGLQAWLPKREGNSHRARRTLGCRLHGSSGNVRSDGSPQPCTPTDWPESRRHKVGC